MHLLVWNIRGLRTSLSRLRLLLHQHSVTFLIVIEPQQPVTRYNVLKFSLVLPPVYLYMAIVCGVFGVVIF